MSDEQPDFNVVRCRILGTTKTTYLSEWVYTSGSRHLTDPRVLNGLLSKRINMLSAKMQELDLGTVSDSWLNLHAPALQL